MKLAANSLFAVTSAKRRIEDVEPVSASNNRPLTLRDVSEASGVSEITVSRVLRTRGDVSDATRQRVLEAA